LLTGCAPLNPVLRGTGTSFVYEWEKRFRRRGQCRMTLRSGRIRRRARRRGQLGLSQ
jgi:hypothetical protein